MRAEVALAYTGGFSNEDVSKDRLAAFNLGYGNGTLRNCRCCNRKT